MLLTEMSKTDNNSCSNWKYDIARACIDSKCKYDIGITLIDLKF